MAQRPPLRESAGLWVGVGAALGALSAVPLIVGVNERVGKASIWNNGWFVLGAGIAVLGALALLWALVLVVAHRYAQSLICPDPSAHGAPQTQRSAPPARAARAGGQRQGAGNLRAALRAVRSDVSTARRLAEEAQASGKFWGISARFPRDGTWKKQRALLAREAPGDAYERTETAF